VSYPQTRQVEIQNTFVKVYLTAQSQCIGLKSNGTTMLTNTLSPPNWVETTSTGVWPVATDLDTYGVGAVAINANGDTFYTSNFNYAGWSMPPNLEAANMKFKHVELYGVSASGINAKGQMYVTDDITKGKWRQIPFPTQRGTQSPLKSISMWSHLMVGIGSDDYVWVSNKPNLGNMIDSLGATASTLQQTKAQLQQAISEQNRSIAGLQTRLRDLDAQVVSLEAQIASQEGQNDQLQVQLQAANVQRNTVRGQLSAAQREVASLEAQLQQKNNEVALLEKETTTYQQSYEEVSTRCPSIPDGQVIADKNTGVLYKVSTTDGKTTLHAFPSVDVYKAHGSPTYTTYESYQLQNCARGEPVSIVNTTPAPIVPTYLPPTNLHPPAMVLILSAKMWMDAQELKALQLVGNNSRPTLTTTLNDDSVFTVEPKTGAITSVGGKRLELKTTSEQKETGWNMVPYTSRGLGNGIAFQLQQYNKKLAVTPGIDTTILHSADSSSLDTVWFVLGV